MGFDDVNERLAGDRRVEEDAVERVARDRLAEGSRRPAPGVRPMARELRPPSPTLAQRPTSARRARVSIARRSS